MFGSEHRRNVFSSETENLIRATSVDTVNFTNKLTFGINQFGLGQQLQSVMIKKNSSGLLLLQIIQQIHTHGQQNRNENRLSLVSTAIYIRLVYSVCSAEQT